MLAQVDFVLKHKCQVVRETGLVVGVSGGPDSLCLLDMLDRLGYTLLVAHLDHCLRKESAEDARYVSRLAEERALPFVCEQQDASAYADRQRCSIEEAARILRYRFLFEQARLHKMGAVVVAHTADDQAETILMHFLRGTGAAGLMGMPYRAVLQDWDAHIPLARPLLDCWRADVLRYCQEQGLTPLQDASNDSLVYMRNRIRHRLIPELETYNPGIRQAILRMAATLRVDHQIVQNWSEATWQRCVLHQQKGLVEISITQVSLLAEGEKRNFLRYVLLKMNPSIRDLTFDAVERAAVYAEQPLAGKTIDIVAGIVIEREGDRLVLHDTHYGLSKAVYPQMDPGWQPLAVPGGIELLNGWKITAEMVEEVPVDWRTDGKSSHWNAWIDARLCDLPLVVRPAQAGERFQPLGMDGKSVKLSDLFTNEKIPRRWRAGYPVVYSAGRAVWVPGLRLAHSFRCTSSTRQVIHLRLVKEEAAHSDPTTG